jgi:hypothetical protein
MVAKLPKFLELRFHDKFLKKVAIAKKLDQEEMEE